MLATSRWRPKPTQLQELQPNRSRILLFGGATAALFFAMLGGYPTVLKQCTADETARLSTRGSEAPISLGCVATRTGPNGWANLEFADGREGFMFLAGKHYEVMRNGIRNEDRRGEMMSSVATDIFGSLRAAMVIGRTAIQGEISERANQDVVEREREEGWASVCQQA